MSYPVDPEHWYSEIIAARRKAHAKHGIHSIESTQVSDWAMLAIVTEELGELAHEMTYDTVNGPGAKRAELIDIAAVVTAWIDKIDGNRNVVTE